MTTAQAPAEAGYPSAVKAWWVVGIFFFASIVSVIDRGILNLVVDPVRQDLMISDVQISLLQGFSFGLFYAVVGLPLGMSADRVSRRWLLIAGISIWSFATILGGLAPNFGWMFVSRILVGLGEATLAPCAVSIISDMFRPERRGRPISVYLMGQAIAGGIAIILTGYILEAAAKGAFSHIPGLAGEAPWRNVFVLCGAAGFIIVLALFTFKEPRRRGVLMETKAGVGFGTAAAYLWRSRGVFIPFYLGFSLVSMHSYGMGAWSAAFLIRVFAQTPGQVSATFGVASVVAGVLGALAAGYAVDRAAKAKIRSGKFLVLLAVCAIKLPSVFVVFAPNLATAVFLLALAVATAPMIGVAMVAAVQEMVPNNMRGVSVSLFGFTNTILGATTGPLFIAMATQHLFHDDKMVGYSILLVLTPAIALAALCYMLSYRSLRRRLDAPSELKTVMDAEAG